MWWGNRYRIAIGVCFLGEIGMGVNVGIHILVG